MEQDAPPPKADEGDLTSPSPVRQRPPADRNPPQKLDFGDEFARLAVARGGVGRYGIVAARRFVLMFSAHDGNFRVTAWRREQDRISGQKKSRQRGTGGNLLTANSGRVSACGAGQVIGILCYFKRNQPATPAILAPFGIRVFKKAATSGSAGAVERLAAPGAADTVAR